MSVEDPVGGQPAEEYDLEIREFEPEGGGVLRYCVVPPKGRGWVEVHRETSGQTLRVHFRRPRRQRLED